ncbi:helix-turn-helix domain-containing protein [Actinokineospora iranica]|uniref:Helix-turn-helix n=1 Tax=Actinokineospora iranica TaxID=1271860 RepID=A0A1G6J918_9PSEU|nr:helix-turn-helix domain-containing protein [Actinokineospora iranica]SDC15093.1 Helix-turn-helix [Actinokineospora iranica]
MDGGNTLAEKLNRLVTTVHPAGRGPFTNEEIAAAIRGEQGIEVSHSAISAWRRGARDNPSFRHLEALAKFFGVPIGYFSDDAESARIDEQLDLVAAWRDAQVRAIAMRAGELSEAGRAAILEMTNRVREIERSAGKPAERP